jgi:hypothetical protein
VNFNISENRKVHCPFSIPSILGTQPPSSLRRSKMSSRLADLHDPPQSDLAGVRRMLTRRSLSPDLLDCSFLRGQLGRRFPPPAAPLQGIETVPPQTQPPTRGPHYLRCRSRHPTFNELPTSDDLPAPLEERAPPEVPDNCPRRGPRQPARFVCWKYAGETDGALGCLTGKLDARESPRTLSRKLDDIPYALDQYKIGEMGSPPRPPRKATSGRDLFAMSIKQGTREDARRRTVSRLQYEKRQHEPEVLLFLETETKRTPLVVSRLSALPGES